MGLSVKSGTITSPTSVNHSSATTGIGFTPKVLILYSTLVTGTGAGTPCYGVGASSSARWTCAQYMNGTTAAVARLFDSSKIFRWVYNVAGAGTLLTADLVTLDSDGFTLDWSVVDASGYTINYICLGGTDLNVKVGTFTTNSATGTQSVASVGFTPKAVLFGSNSEQDGTIVTNRGVMNVGAATSSSARSTVCSSSEPLGTTNATGLMATNRCWNYSLNSIFGDMDFVSLDSGGGGGFTVDITTVTSSTQFPIGYLALGGTAQFFVGTFNQPGSTGAQGVTGVGFPPSIELFWSGGKAASNSLSDNARFMLGHGIDSSNRAAMWASQADNDTTLTDSRATVQNQCVEIRVDDATTVLAHADFTSQDSDGFTVNWGTADATARVIGFMSVGAAVSASSATTGTVTTATEADIVSGGKTVILTLTNDTWVASGGTFDAQRQNIIDGMTAASSPATGWNNVVKALQGVSGVVRTSATVVTITLDAQATYNIASNETVTVTIPATALTGAVAVVSSPTFTITAAGSAITGQYYYSTTGVNNV